MLKDDLKMDLTKTLSIQDNLKKSIIVTTGSCLIGAFFAFVAFLLTFNYWFLSLALILFLGGFAFAILVKKIQSKYLDKDGNLKNVQF